MKTDKYRLDYMFSYWIFAAYILFYFHIIPYNPKYILILGVIFNLIQFLIFIWREVSYIRLLLFTFINCCIKIIPIYTLWNTTVTRNDNIFYLELFFVYLIWIFINDVNIKKIYFSTKDTEHSLTTPLSNLIIEIFNK